MKWKIYNKLNDKQKEEYNYKFTNNINDLFLVQLQGLLILIIGIQLFIEYKNIDLILLGLSIIFFSSIYTLILVYKKAKFLKEKTGSEKNG